MTDHGARGRSAKSAYPSRRFGELVVPLREQIRHDIQRPLIQ
jgi:hypothetical protein